MVHARSALNPRSVFILIVGLVVIFFILEVTNTTHFLHSRNGSGTIPTLSPSGSKTKTAGASQTSPLSQKSINSVGSPVAGPAPGDKAPETPFGSFVSNHHPNLSGTPAPATEQSVCNTTPGASCSIVFSQNGTTKRLPSQVADSHGLVSWTWDVKQAGFSEGSWQITAIATLNGQTASAKDSINLVISP